MPHDVLRPRTHATSRRETKTDMVRAHLAHLLADAPPHTRLPTERDLAVELDVSRPTVRQALAHLEVDGLVYRVQGAGTFAAPHRITKTIELTSFSEDMRARGLEPGSRTVLAEVAPAGSLAATALGIGPDDAVVQLERVRTADGTPVCHEVVRLPGWVGTDILDEIDGGSLYEILERRGVRVDHAEQSVTATVLDAATAQLLDAPPRSAALHVARTTFDVRGRAVEHAESTYRADRYDYRITIRRRTREENPR